MKTSSVGPAASTVPVQQHGAVAEFRHAAEIVGRDQHHPALVAQRAQQLDDRLLGLDVDAGEGLVEQDDPAVLRQRAGEEDALLLAARELADLALAEVAHADAVQRRSTASWSLAPGQAQHVHVAVAAHHHHVLDQNGEVPVDLLALRHIGDELALQRLGCTEPPRIEIDPAASRDEAHDRLEQGRLAAAVDADQRRDGAASGSRSSHRGAPCGRCGR